MTVKVDGPWYVYGVVPSGLEDVPGNCKGIADESVGSISAGEIAALVSPAPQGKVRPTRSNLSAHEAVVGTVHRAGPVLPMAFGAVMADTHSVTDEFLNPNVGRFTAMLEELSGKDEFRLRVRYLPDVAFREVVDRSRLVRRLRDKVARGGRAVVADQIELGEVVLAELQRLRESDSEELWNALTPFAAGWRMLDDPSDDVAVYAACLVDRANAADWDAALEVVSSKQRSRLHFEVVGPLPAWDFVDTPAGVR